jgi:hypothetical protein
VPEDEDVSVDGERKVFVIRGENGKESRVPLSRPNTKRRTSESRKFQG